MRVIPVLAAVAAFAAAPVLPGHRLLVDVSGLRVYGPSDHAGVPCPRLLTLPRSALATVRRAVTLAMPQYERELKLDGRDPIVKVRPSASAGYDYRAGGCGQAAWSKSVVATVLLPHVEPISASMSQHTFAVGRVREGWVLWGYIH